MKRRRPVMGWIGFGTRGEQEILDEEMPRGSRLTASDSPGCQKQRSAQGFGRFPGHFAGSSWGSYMQLTLNG